MRARSCRDRRDASRLRAHEAAAYDGYTRAPQAVWKMVADSMNTTLVEDEIREEQPPLARAWLVCIGSAEDNLAAAGRILEIDESTIVRFGRDEAADGISVTVGEKVRVGIPFGWVSGEHAELAFGIGGDARFVLTDLGSRNGTHVGGQRIHGAFRLRPGEVFEIGRSFWMVREMDLRNIGTARIHEIDPTGTASPHLHHIQRTLHRLAKSSIPIVVRGETGTGKSYLARAIHRASGRTGELVVANLGGLSDARVESTLFGEAGTVGLFERANGGTLVLDDLGEVSPGVQTKLLGALAEGRAPRVGEQALRSFDVRLVATTLHDLARMVEAGRFRGDLYSRLSGFVAEIPPLRSRREDIGLLSRAFIGDLQREGRPTRLTSNALRRLLKAQWPFNVRQLRQTLGTAALLASGDGTITADALAEVLERDDGMPENPDEVRLLRDSLLRAMARCGADPERLAVELQRTPAEVERWIERFALTTH
jgi:hypothetical protein